MNKHKWLILILIGLLVLIYVMTKNVILLVIVFMVWTMIVAIGVYFIQLNFFITAKNKLDKEGTVALTFDDGPHPIYTPKVLAILKEKNVHATFFLIGKNVLGNEHIVQQLVEDGHQIGNHSFKHHNFSPLWSQKKITEDIEKCQTLLATFTSKNIPYRPPFGVTNPTIAKVVKKLNLNTVGWSLRSYDTVAKDKQSLVEKIGKSIKSNDIILLHEAAPFTATALSEIIDSVRNQGLRFDQLI